MVLDKKNLAHFYTQEESRNARGFFPWAFLIWVYGFARAFLSDKSINRKPTFLFVYIENRRLWAYGKKIKDT